MRERVHFIISMNWEEKIAEELICCLCGATSLYIYAGNTLCENHISMQYGYKPHDEVFKKNFMKIQKGKKIVSESQVKK